MIAGDALDQEIEAKRRELETARAQIEALAVELRALERAAALRPARQGQRSSLPPSSPRRRSGRGGRMPGAISKPWRQILIRVAKVYPNGAIVEDIAAFGASVGLSNLRPRDARQQCEKYLRHGFVEQVSGNRYKVTAAAIERFAGADPAPRPSAPDDRQASFKVSNGSIHEGLSV